LGLAGDWPWAAEATTTKQLATPATKTGPRPRTFAIVIANLPWQQIKTDCLKRQRCAL
jgi:hypothetical protein